jgi:hypothetical protein
MAKTRSTKQVDRTVDPNESPVTQAGVPPVQQQERTSLEGPETISGRPRDEGDDATERSGAQTPGRKDPEATQPPGQKNDKRNTL